MQLDNQGRALLRLPTTMRLALSKALDGEDATPLRDTVFHALLSNHGYRKVPAWTVTRKGKR